MYSWCYTWCSPKCKCWGLLLVSWYCAEAVTLFLFFERRVYATMLVCFMCVLVFADAKVRICFFLSCMLHNTTDWQGYTLLLDLVICFHRFWCTWQDWKPMPAKPKPRSTKPKGSANSAKKQQCWRYWFYAPSSAGRCNGENTWATWFNQLFPSYRAGQKPRSSIRCDCPDTQGGRGGPTHSFAATFPGMLSCR